MVFYGRQPFLYAFFMFWQWRQVFNKDVSKFAEILREQSKKFSEGCVKGLKDEAASKLLQLIEEKKKVEADAIDVWKRIKIFQEPKDIINF